MPFAARTESALCISACSVELHVYPPITFRSWSDDQADAQGGEPDEL